ncbi:hypothetical protein M422DRAFT_66602 [Sphaerobolus stellatus SS14]|nr:hypothetical protein M422DRAFT_66602 [Sphaerobolus stellatus SS14]
MPRILFVSGFDRHTRARDLAYEFERYGPLVRCDVPAPRNYHAATPPYVTFVHLTFPSISFTFRTSRSTFRFRSSASYAFVEFRHTRDAEDAYHEMHGRSLNGYRLSVQWAKNPPSAVWRFDKRSPPHRRGRDRRSRSRSRSPRRDRERDQDKDDRRRERDPDDRDDKGRDRDEKGKDKGEGDERRQRRSRSPVRRSSRSPVRRGSKSPERRRRSRTRSQSRDREERDERDKREEVVPPEEKNDDAEPKEEKAATPPRE